MEADAKETKEAEVMMRRLLMMKMIKQWSV
jgi:hypothetical protein